MSTDLRRVLESLSDAELDRLLSMLKHPKARHIISRYGDIDSPSMLFNHLLKAFPALRLFLRISLLFPWHW